MKRYLASEVGSAHAICAGGGLLLMVAMLLLLVVGGVLPAPALTGNATSDLIWLVLLLLLAVAIPAAIGVMLASWPVRLPWLGTGRPAVDLNELASAEQRSRFRHLLEYRSGIAETLQRIEDHELQRLLRQLLEQTDTLLVALFQLARAAEDYRQRQVLQDDLGRLLSQREPLSATEQAQLATLRRLDEATRLSDAMIGEAQAVLGRCYAQSREVALVRDLATFEGRHLTGQLREQAAQLGHLAQALRQLSNL